MSRDDVRRWLTELMPGSDRLRVADVSADGVVVCAVDAEGLEVRPGGTVSGPAIFWAVDISAFVAVNARTGPAPSALLVQTSISFVEAADPGALEIVARVVKLASRSAVVDARVTDPAGRLVALATLHFALPSRATRNAAR